MKTCATCEQELSLDSFSKKGSGTQSKCKNCNREYQRNHYKENKNRYLESNYCYKNKNKERWRAIKEANPCADCGGYFHHFQMDFDHIGDKNYSISSMSSMSWDKIEKEIYLCDIVCANCHRLRTFTRYKDN